MAEECYQADKMSGNTVKLLRNHESVLPCLDVSLRMA